MQIVKLEDLTLAQLKEVRTVQHIGYLKGKKLSVGYDVFVINKGDDDEYQLEVESGALEVGLEYVEFWDNTAIGQTFPSIFTYMRDLMQKLYEEESGAKLQSDYAYLKSLAE